MKRTILFIILAIIMCSITLAYPTGCEERGSYVYCTGEFNVKDFNMGGDSLYLHDATISYTGGTGRDSQPGESGVIDIYNANRVKLENVNITSRGGDGGGADAFIHPDGGDGGPAGLNIDAVEVMIENLNVDFRGGDGGQGDENEARYWDSSRERYRYVSGRHPVGSGGEAGETILNINSEKTYIDGLTGLMKGPRGGDAMVRAMATPLLDRVDCRRRERDGAHGGNPAVTINSKDVTFINSDLLLQGGIGGDGDAHVDCDSAGSPDDSERDADDAVAAGGGAGGSIFEINADIINTNNIFINGVGGTPGQPESDADALSMDLPIDTDGGADGNEGRPHIFEINSITGNLISTSYDYIGGIGGDGIADGAHDNGGTYSDAADGGAGGSIYTTINCIDVCNFSDSNLFSVGGKGGKGDEDSRQELDTASKGGSGGFIYFTYNNIIFNNVDKNITGGLGHEHLNHDISGDGGDIALDITNSIIQNSNWSLLGGDAGAGSTSTSYVDDRRHVGSSGAVIINMYEKNVIDNSDLILEGGKFENYGSTIICYDGGPGSDSLGGNSELNVFGNELLIKDSEIKFEPGVGGCNKGGDSIIKSNYNIYFLNNLIRQTQGYGYNAIQYDDLYGEVRNYLNGNVIFYDTEFYAWYYFAGNTDLSYYTKYIKGDNVKNFLILGDSFMNFEVDGVPTEGLNLSFVGDLQKFGFDAGMSVFGLHIDWNSDKAKYRFDGTHTGSVTMNESVDSMGYFEFIVDIIYEQILPTYKTITSNYELHFDLNIDDYSAINNYAEILFYVNDNLVSDINDFNNIIELSEDKIEKINFSQILPGLTYGDNISFEITTGKYLMYDRAVDKDLPVEDKYINLTYVEEDGFHAVIGAHFYPFSILDNYYYIFDFDWFDAYELCENVDDKLYGNWHLPTIEQATKFYNNFDRFPEYKEQDYWTRNISNGVRVVINTNDGSFSQKGVFESAGAVCVNNDDIGSMLENSFIVQKSYPYNVGIDIGDTGEIDYVINGLLNETQTLHIDSSFLNRVLDNCDETDCDIPIRFVSETDGEITVSNVSNVYGVEQIITHKLDIPINVYSDSPGKIQMFPLSLGYPTGDGQTIPIMATTDNYLPTEYNINIIQSNVSAEYPPNVNYFELYPMFLTQKNVQPRGQRSNVPIYNIENLHPTEDVDVFLRMEKSWEEQNIECIDIKFEGEDGEFDVSTTPQKLIETLESHEESGVWVYADFDCTWEDFEHALYEPEFIFIPHCSNCVLTYDVPAADFCDKPHNRFDEQCYVIDGCGDDTVYNKYYDTCFYTDLDSDMNLWENSKEHCDNLEINGIKEWRFPTRDEYTWIQDTLDTGHRTIPGLWSGFPSGYGWYWTNEPGPEEEYNYYWAALLMEPGTFSSRLVSTTSHTCVSKDTESVQ